MASDIDLASEALARQVHRELNGLTRTSRRPPPQQPLYSATTAARRELSRKASDSQRAGSREPSRRARASPPDAQKRRKRSVADWDSSDDSLGPSQTHSQTGSDSESQSRCASPLVRKRKKDRAADEDGDHVGVTQQVPSKGAGEDRKRTASAAAQRLSTEAPKQTKVVVQEAKHQAGLTPAITAAACAPGAVAATQPLVNPQPSASQAQTALEAAALSASTSVREQVKQISESKALHVSGQRTIKCFHAGVRWGIRLSPEAVQSRSDLATALNDAFAGQILSCGRGDMLVVVFLDAEGRTTEFPSLRGTGAKESATKWKAMVDKARKIYVRRA